MQSNMFLYAGLARSAPNDLMNALTSVSLSVMVDNQPVVFGVNAVRQPFGTAQSLQLTEQLVGDAQGADSATRSIPDLQPDTLAFLVQVSPTHTNCLTHAKSQTQHEQSGGTRSPTCGLQKLGRFIGSEKANCCSFDSRAFPTSSRLAGWNHFLIHSLSLAHRLNH